MFRSVDVFSTIFAFFSATCCANVARLRNPTILNALPVMQGELTLGKNGSSVNPVLNSDIYLDPHLVAPSDERQPSRLSPYKHVGKAPS
jgi:hypothetical protein